MLKMFNLVFIKYCPKIHHIENRFIIFIGSVYSQTNIYHLKVYIYNYYTRYNYLQIAGNMKIKFKVL